MRRMTALEKLPASSWLATESVVSRDIWLTGSAGQSHASILSALQLAGFATRSCAGVGDILDLPSQVTNAPLAIIAGVGALAGLDGQALSRLQDSNATLIGLLEQDSLAERLQASRLGADFCLAPPFEARLLTDYLDEVSCERDFVPWKVVLVSEDASELDRLTVWFDARDLNLRVVAAPDTLFAAIDEEEPDVILLGKLHSLPRDELARVIRARNRMLADAIQLLPEPDSWVRDDAGIDTLDLLLIRLGHKVDLIRQRRSRYAATQRVLQEQSHIKVALDTHAIMSVTDLTGTIIDINDKFCEISGYAASELIGQSHSILKSGFHDAAFYARMWHTIRSGAVWQGEICNRRKDGSVYWVESTITPLRNAEGHPTSYMSLRTDITSTKTQQIMLHDLAGISAYTDERFLDAAVEWLARSLVVRMACIALQGAPATLARPVVLWDQGSLRPEVKLQLPLALASRQQMADGDLTVIESGLADHFPADSWVVDNRMCSCLAMAFRDSNGRILGHLVIMDQRDMPDWREKSKWLAILAPRLGNIVEASRAQQELQLREQQYRTLAKNIPGMVYRAGPDWHCGFITGCEQVCGHEEAGFLSGDVTWKALIYPDDLERVCDEASALEAIPGTMIQHYRIRHSDGTTRWVSDHKRSVFDEQGRFCGIDGVLFDITANKSIAVENEMHQERLSRSQLYANIGTWDWNIETGALLWTERIPVLFGYANGELETSYENFISAIHPEDRDLVRNAVNSSLKDGVVYEVEHRVVWPDGTVRWLLERGDVIRSDAGHPVRMLGVVQDVTARVQAEQAMLEARAEAIKANQAKSEFLSSMSHELRTPMNSILGFAQLLELDAQLNQDQQEGVDEIRKAGSHLMNLINEILDLSRIESGSFLLSLEPVCFADVLDECLALVKPMADMRAINIRVAAIGKEQLLADRTRLKQVLLNLLANAIKYNRQGGLVFVSGDRVSSQSFRLCINDTGSGIPLESQGRIFQAFTRVHADLAGIEGTGIGLAITQRLVHLMGGEIDFDSTPNIGSSFWVELPLAHDTRVQVAADDSIEAAFAGVAQEAVAGKLLLIDDNPANLRLVARIFEPFAELELLVAHSAALGLELARINQPDLILLDINMPDMDGYKVLSMIRSDPDLDKVPVLALTANALPVDIERGRMAGFSEYITKPIDVSGLVSVVRQSLRQRGVHTGASCGESGQSASPRNNMSREVTAQGAVCS